MKIKTQKLKNAAYVVTSLVVGIVGAFSGLSPKHVSAAQMGARSIQLSSSVFDANNVQYRVSFAVSTTDDIGGIVIDFCDNTPIIGDSCSAPAGFNSNESTLTVNAESNIGALTVDASTTANSVRLTTTPASVSSATVVSFVLGDGTNAMHNPTANGSFYARIYTYDTNGGATGHSTASPTGYVDYGGVAMSTATIINITARVMETLSFCVYNTTCGDDPSLIIGDTVGTTIVLDHQDIDTGAANFSISTNASGGASIRMKGDTLRSGANDIAAAGAAAAMVAGTEEFGLRISTAGTSITAEAPYNGAAGSYGLIVSGGGADDVTSTFGGLIATLSDPVDNSVSTITFAATASLVTEAGTYTAAQQLIATGTF